MLDRLTSIDQVAWRDAARAALQGACAAVATFLVMRLLGLPEVFVGVLSAVFILQPSIGGTASSARSRLVATLVGTAAGLTAFLALPYGVGTTFALALSVFVVSGMAFFRPDWTYGLVAAVGISLGSEQDAVQTAVDRGISIALGAGLGLLASLLVWPERSQTRLEKHFRRAVAAVRDRVDDAVATAAGQGEARASEIAPRYHREIGLAREAHRYARPGGERVEERLAELERLYNAAIIVDRADEVLSDDRGLVHDMADQVREVREGLVEALDRVLRREADPAAVLGKIDRALRGLSDRSVSGAESPEAMRARLALAFGLWELRCSLGRLLDASEPSGQG